MTNDQNPLAVTLNGAKIRFSPDGGPERLDPALRCVALSDSPVLVEAPEEHQGWLVERIHQLGRRSMLPLHRCPDLESAGRLLAAVGKDGSPEEALGTWALFDVARWPKEPQRALASLLELLDLNRLHGRLRHDRIPRVIVVKSEAKLDLDPALSQRAGYFHLLAVRQPTEGVQTNVFPQ